MLTHKIFPLLKAVRMQLTSLLCLSDVTFSRYVVYRDSLHQVAGEKWHMVSSAVQAEMARMAAASAWGLGTNSINVHVFTMTCM